MTALNTNTTTVEMMTNKVSSAFQRGSYDPYLRRKTAPPIEKSWLEMQAKAILALSDREILDAAFLENELIPTLGLNDELLEEQPPEFSESFGKGIFLWQYPNQVAAFLAHLAKVRPPVSHYLEIGSRWGGMFFLMTMWLKRVSGESFSAGTALDLVSEPPLVEAFRTMGSQFGLEITYLQKDSHDEVVEAYVVDNKPDIVLIDGEHSVQAALHDHMMVLDAADWIIHHDISNDSLPQLRFLFDSLSRLSVAEFESQKFDHQYKSVGGSHLGIGLLTRKLR